MIAHDADVLPWAVEFSRSTQHHTKQRGSNENTTGRLSYHTKQLSLPIPIMLAHAALAVIGFLLLLVCVVQTH